MLSAMLDLVFLYVYDEMNGYNLKQKMLKVLSYLLQVCV